MASDETVKEIAKAAQALAPAINTPVKVVAEALGWCGRVLGRPLEVAVGMLGDWVYAKQVEARIAIIEKTLRRMGDLKVPAEALPPGFLVPFLDACGNAQEESLQDLWANLLASASTSGAHRNPAFIHTLRAMSADDAGELRRFLGNVAPAEAGSLGVIRGEGIVFMGRVPADVVPLMKSVFDVVEPTGRIDLGRTFEDNYVGLGVELSHLVALGCLALISTTSEFIYGAARGEPDVTRKPRPETRWSLCVTAFGRAFSDAVGVAGRSSAATPEGGADA